VADAVKEVVWVASSLRDLRAFPDEVMDVLGYALHQAQMGYKHEDAKPLKGYKGAGVLEVVDGYDGDTYRAVYTVKFDGYVYALHAFQKKSKSGSATPKADLDLIRSRLKLAEVDHKQRTKRKVDG
jgi:phage-related protein